MPGIDLSAGSQLLVLKKTLTDKSISYTRTQVQILGHNNPGMYTDPILYYHTSLTLSYTYYLS